MQVSVENLSSIERRLTIDVPADRVESEVEARLKQTAQSVRVDGFRPGKVPMKVIKQRYGSGVRQEVISEIMRQSFQQAVSQENLNPVGQPSIEPTELEPGKDLQYTATFDVFPEIEFSDLAKLDVEKVDALVEDADIDAQIQQLQEQQQQMKDTKRAAKNGDQVVISFEGTVDGEAFEGGSSQETPLVLGSNSMIAGFEDGLLGIKPGEERVLDLEFPAAYQSEDLAGKAVQFTVKAIKSFKPVPAELNDEFFAKYGVEEGGEAAFRKELRDNMESALQAALLNKLKSNLVEKLVEAHEVALPAALVEQEIGQIRQEMMQQFGGGQQVDPAMFPDELFKGQAEKRVASGLIINQFVRDNNITATDDQVRAAIENFAKSYDDPAQVVEHVYGNEQQLQHFKSVAIEEQVIAGLLGKVNIKDVQGNFQEVMYPPAPEAEEPEA
jgi:trigger factor